MPKLFLRPNWLHDPDNITSATTEAGVGPGESTPSTANAGNLRLRQAGAPSSSQSLDVALQAGGNPEGYSLDDYGRGGGASVRWKNTTDGATSWRGYSDSIYLQRVLLGQTFSSSARAYSQMRELPDGYLGFIRGDSGASAVFHRIAPDGTVSTASMGTGIISSTYMSALAVMPSGRLVALIVLSSGFGRYATYYSDDNGTTWAQLSNSAMPTISASYEVCMEVVDGDLVVVAAGSAASAQTLYIYTSRDGGCSFTRTYTGSSFGAARTCTTLDGRVLVVLRQAIQTAIYEVLPGGGLSGLLATSVGDNDNVHAIARRDDGTIWVAGWHVSGTRAMDLRFGVSLDGGATFTDAAGSQDVLNMHDTPAAAPIDICHMTCWRGQLVMLVYTDADSGTDNNLYLLVFGGWGSVTDLRFAVASLGQPYEHTYFPQDYPSAGAWALNNVGAGATITNQGPLNIVATVANNSYYSANGTFWTGSSGDSKRIRFRCRVNSGGDTTADYAILRWHITDGANCQQVKLQFASTGWRVTDGAGNVLATITAAMTGWCDIVAFYQHESSANTGRVTIYYRMDADTEGVWTLGVSNAAIADSVGAGNQLYFGGTAAGVVDWDVLLLAVADDDCGFAEGFTNPDDLAGRPLPPDTEMWVKDGLLLGAYSGAGVKGDAYVVETLATYGKENVWAELRPSRRLQSTADNTTWAVVFDAGTNNLWHVKDVALFGTNAREITVQLNAADSWGAPSASLTMTVDATSFPVGAGNRGRGYVGPTTSAAWRPHQWRSDGDSHRWFAKIGESVYEITDNDAERIYIKDVDLSAAAGTVYIFGDRAGYYAASTVHRYRFMRVLYASQDTADGAYRLGCVVAGQGYTPPIEYSHDFADETQPNAPVVVSDAGYRSSSRQGPRRHMLRIQWSPINRMHPTYGKVGEEIEALYRALEGAHTPVAVWRDTTDITTLGLYRVVGTLSRPNQRGEGSTAIATIDPLTLEEEL